MMLELTMEEIGQALGYPCSGRGETVITGVAIDSRQVQKGDLFVAIAGEKVDGHQYIEQALRSGAAGVALSAADFGSSLGDNAWLLVEDGVTFIQKLGRLIRQRSGVPVVAVTGSSGKTTTKDLLKAMLEDLGPVVATQGNNNNELGLPLTLCRIESTTRAVVVEMGMRGLGQIDFLCQLAQPDYGLITNIGKVHSELLGSQENIAQAKAELLAYIGPEGVAALNEKDRTFLESYAQSCAGKIVWCSVQSGQGDVWAEAIEENTDGTIFTVAGSAMHQTLQSRLQGLHNVENALQALVIARALHVSWQGIEKALGQAQLTAMRMEKLKTQQGAVIYNDAYNANPDSMQAALAVLAQQKGRRAAVLGDMYELGQYEEESHRQIGAAAMALGLELLIAVGRLGNLIGQGAEAAAQAGQQVYYAEDNAQAAAILQSWLKAGDQVLIKGSRGMKMEEIVEIIMR